MILLATFWICHTMGITRWWDSSYLYCHRFINISKLTSLFSSFINASLTVHTFLATVKPTTGYLLRFPIPFSWQSVHMSCHKWFKIWAKQHLDPSTPSCRDRCSDPTLRCQDTGKQAQKVFNSCSPLPSLSCNCTVSPGPHWKFNTSNCVQLLFREPIILCLIFHH